jgi:ATP-dependent Lon protease, bacterial type
MVLLHETNMNLKIGKKHGSEIYNRVKDDDYYGIAVASKEGTPARYYAESDIYKIGTLIKVENAKEMRDFYHLKVEILERVQIKELIPDGINYRAHYELLPDEIDIDPEDQAEMMKHVRYLVSEISENFKDSKSFVDQMNQLDDLRKVIANIYPYMRISHEEKQTLLETVPLKRRA